MIEDHIARFEHMEKSSARATKAVPKDSRKDLGTSGQNEGNDDGSGKGKRVVEGPNVKEELTPQENAS